MPARAVTLEMLHISKAYFLVSLVQRRSSLRSIVAHGGQLSEVTKLGGWSITVALTLSSKLAAVAVAVALHADHLHTPAIGRAAGAVQFPLKRTRLPGRTRFQRPEAATCALI